MKARQIIKDSINNLFNAAEFTLEHPMDEKMGDYASNVAMILSKKEQKSPRELAEEIAEKLRGQGELKGIVEKIEVAGPGFVNFFLSNKYLTDEVSEVLSEKEAYGRGVRWEEKKVMVEYTDPNPFKQFHIGHLMSNTIGESLSRLIEFSGAEVKRACYQGDVGMHVAKSIWGIRELLKEKKLSIEEIGEMELDEKAAFLGKGYATGAAGFEENEESKKAINDLNKVIYERSDEGVNKIYDLGRRWSLDYFET
ncbi:MAG: Arginine-tRNA ligase, partial [Candidatus Collierbacteria bacterium GW2011_GWF2_44_15]